MKACFIFLSVYISLTTWAQKRVLNVKDYGAKGDGINDDVVAITKTTKEAADGTVIFPEGIYRIKSPLDLQMKNISWKGVPEKTIIVGDFDYALIKFRQMINCTIEGITFKNDYVNPKEDAGKSILYSYGSIVNVK